MLASGRFGPVRWDRGVGRSPECVERRVASSNLGPCPDCGALVSRLAETCLSCGRPLQPPKPREGLFLRMMNQATAAGFWLLLVLILVPILGGIIGFLLTR